MRALLPFRDRAMSRQGEPSLLRIQVQVHTPVKCVNLLHTPIRLPRQIQNCSCPRIRLKGRPGRGPDQV